jgi:hypothetical protein
MRNEKEQTGVEWLIQKLINKQNGVFDGFPYLSVDEIYDKAKEMEKEQKYKFADEYCEAVMSGCNLRPEQYDNETYGEK